MTDIGSNTCRFLICFRLFESFILKTDRIGFLTFLQGRSQITFKKTENFKTPSCLLSQSLRKKNLHFYLIITQTASVPPSPLLKCWTLFMNNPYAKLMSFFIVIYNLRSDYDTSIHFLSQLNTKIKISNSTGPFFPSPNA